MRRLEQIASENFIEHTAKDLEVMEIVRQETLEGLKHSLWKAGCDVGQVAEAIAEFKRENK